MSLLPLRQLYTHKSLKLIGDSMDPETLKWFTAEVKKRVAKRRRAAAKKTRPEPKLESPTQLPTICPAKTRRGPKLLRQQWRLLKKKCKLLATAPKIRKDKRRAKGFVNETLTRDGFAAPQPHRTRRSPSRTRKFSK
jgi:hypothetical protein